MRSIHLVIVIFCLIAILVGLLLGTRNCSQKDKYTLPTIKPPIVLIPGLASSRLYGVWKNMENLKDTVENFPDLAKYIEDHLSEFDHDFVSPDCKPTQDTWHRIWVDLSAAMPIPNYPDCWQKLAQTKYVSKNESVTKNPEDIDVNTFREAENSHYRKRHNFGGTTAWREEIPNDEISNYDSNGKFTWAATNSKSVPNPPITRDFGGLCGCKTLAALEEKECIDLSPAGVFLTLVEYLTGKKGDILEPYEAPQFTRDAVGGDCKSGYSWCANPVDGTNNYSLCDCSGEPVNYFNTPTPTKNKGAKATNLSDITLVAAPYDWTKCLQRETGIVSENNDDNEYLDIYFGHLKRLIEFQYYGLDGKRLRKVCVASHSLGCIMFKVFLDWYLPRRQEVNTNPNFVQNWKDTFIEIWIPLAGPFAGAPKALKAALSGDDEGLGTVCKAELWKCNEKRNCMSWYQAVETQAAGLLMCCPDDIAMKNLNVVTITDDTPNCKSAIVKTPIKTDKIFTTDHDSLKILFNFSNTVPNSNWVKIDQKLIGSYHALAETWWGSSGSSTTTNCSSPGKPNTPLQYKKVNVPIKNYTCQSAKGVQLPTKESCANIMYTHPGVNCLHIYGASTASSMKTPISFIYGNYGEKPEDYNQFAPTAIYEQDFYQRLLNPSGDIVATDIQKFLLQTKESVAVITKNTENPQFSCVSPSDSVENWMIGDGTVPWISLRVSEIWANDNQKDGINGTVKSLCLKGENFDHLGLISQEQTWLVMAAQLGLKMKSQDTWYSDLVKIWDKL